MPPATKVQARGIPSEAGGEGGGGAAAASAASEEDLEVGWHLVALAPRGQVEESPSSPSSSPSSATVATSTSTSQGCLLLLLSPPASSPLVST